MRIYLYGPITNEKNYRLNFLRAENTVRSQELQMNLPNNGGNVIKEVSKKILNHYGIMHQKFKAIEELAEFIVALHIVIYGK